MLRELNIRRYDVVPLSRHVGIVRWMYNCDTLHQARVYALHICLCTHGYIDCSLTQLPLINAPHSPTQMVKRYREGHDPQISLNLESHAIAALTGASGDGYDKLTAAQKVDCLHTDLWGCSCPYVGGFGTCSKSKQMLWS